MFLKNKIITLRALELSDVDYMYEWENDPDIWEVSSTLAPISRLTLTQYISDSIGRDIFEILQLRLVISDNRTNFPIGLIDLFDIDVLNSRGTIGISINEKPYRNKGYGKNALLLLIDYSFHFLHFHNLFARIDEDNIASIKLFESCGFTQCGFLPEWHKTSQGWKNQVEMIRKNDE